MSLFLPKIPSIHVDPLEEPVVDIAVGGYDLPYQPEGFTGAWIVTINGRVRLKYGHILYDMV